MLEITVNFIRSPNWGSEPWLIYIGNHTEISFDVSTWCFRNQEQYKHIVKFEK